MGVQAGVGRWGVNKMHLGEIIKIFEIEGEGVFLRHFLTMIEPFFSPKNLQFGPIPTIRHKRVHKDLIISKCNHMP